MVGRRRSCYLWRNSCQLWRGLKNLKTSTHSSFNVWYSLCTYTERSVGQEFDAKRKEVGPKRKPLYPFTKLWSWTECARCVQEAFVVNERTGCRTQGKPVTCFCFIDLVEDGFGLTLGQNCHLMNANVSPTQPAKSQKNQVKVLIWTKKKVAAFPLMKAATIWTLDEANKNSIYVTEVAKIK